MVSFRYHVVTIVAVFLALGLGILMGSTVIKQSVVDELRTRAENALTNSEALRKDVADLRQQLRTWDAFAPQAERVMVSERLTGRTVVILTADGVDPAEIDGVRKALSDADASVSGVVVLSSRMRLVDDGPRAALAQALGLTDTSDPVALAQLAAQAIARRLNQGPPLEGSGTTDLLDALDKAQLLSVREPADGLQGIGGSTQTVVLLVGGPGQAPADPQAFFLPLLETLVQSGEAVAAAGNSTSAYDIVGPVRGDGTLDGAIVTVDNVDLMMGRVALVLGLQQLLESGPASCADFGIEAGACSLIPVPQATP